MAHVATLRPFGFSQPTRGIGKTKRRADTPVPTDDFDTRVRSSTDSGHHKSKSRRVSLPNNTLGPYWAAPSASQPRAAALRSGLYSRKFPDEEDDDPMPPPRYSRSQEKRRPPRLQPPSMHARRPSIVSPLSPTSMQMFSNLQLHSPSDVSASRDDVSEKQLQQQLKDVYSALRHVEEEGEKIRSQMNAGRVNREWMERELEKTRRENQRLLARLEEMSKSSKLKSPLSAKSDDAWGCSMYDMEG